MTRRRSIKPTATWIPEHVHWAVRTRVGEVAQGREQADIGILSLRIRQLYPECPVCDEDIRALVAAEAAKRSLPLSM